MIPYQNQMTGGLSSLFSSGPFSEPVPQAPWGNQLQLLGSPPGSNQHFCAKCSAEAMEAHEKRMREHYKSLPRTTCGWCERDTIKANGVCEFCGTNLWVFGKDEPITKEK